MKGLPISRENLTAHLVAGLTNSVVGIPDGMASDRTETTEAMPEQDIVLAGDTLGSSIRDALAAADGWLEQG